MTQDQASERVRTSGLRRDPGPGFPRGRSDHAEAEPWEQLLCGDISDKQPELLNALTGVSPRSRGILYFDSCGGSVYTGLALATLIATRALNVTAVVLGECSSAALMPFAACRRRFVTRHSTLLFHPMRWQSEEEVRLEEAAEWARHFAALEEDLDGLVCRLMPLPPEKLREWTRPGKFVSGPELAAAGLAEIYDPFARRPDGATDESPGLWDISEGWHKIRSPRRTVEKD